ncbi:hypothetical protein [Lysinibacillus pakistanensis]|uniref:Uncharacterized protein n=1 Tax=Lysinibacillus pakistanensis TaxID=759811 RepID=A0AAX3X187_9BACI|nr:hypothetical protein [Lysinibacillus pakistanensis]MDM5233492.1 hypothetical protein [Lysinibacillus pakistanensis]WHY48964.1 hypothetical protein QNH22_12295 [Lysinibacillus pakistanensis]WHY53975.1 hypothetical protein QNH24_12275 [Lysinibacillus pakistanensis]
MNFFNEFKDLKRIDKINFFASLTTLSGISLLTVLNVTQNFLTNVTVFQIGVLFILTSFFITLNGYIFGLAIWAFKHYVKTDSSYWTVLLYIGLLLLIFGIFFILTDAYIIFIEIAFK